MSTKDKKPRSINDLSRLQRTVLGGILVGAPRLTPETMERLGNEDRHNDSAETFKEPTSIEQSPPELVEQMPSNVVVQEIRFEFPI